MGDGVKICQQCLNNIKINIENIKREAIENAYSKCVITREEYCCKEGIKYTIANKLSNECKPWFLLVNRLQELEKENMSLKSKLLHFLEKVTN